jgi:hypothetical protein
MSCGTALFYLRLAIRVFGHIPLLELLPSVDQPLLLARLRLGDAVSATDEDRALFHSIRSRRTYGDAFLSQSLPSPLLQALAAAAEQEGSHLVLLQSDEERQAVAELVTDGDLALRENPEFWREEAEADPMGSDRHTVSEFLSSFFWPLSAALRTPAILRKDRRLVLDAPTIAVLATEGDRTEDWLRAGQALGAVLLRADVSRVEASFLSQPMEVLGLRPGLQALIGGRIPQLILRLGFTDGKYLPHTPRRGVEDVMCHNHVLEAPATVDLV